MEHVVENYGLSHIGIQIFGYLDNQSLVKSRLVAKSWMDLIDQKLLESRKRSWTWKKEKLEVLEQNHMDFYETLPHWKSVNKHFRQNRSVEDTRKFIEIMESYFRRYENIYLDYDPLMTFVLEESKAKMRLVLPSVDHINHYIDGRTMLHVAVTGWRVEIVQMLFEEFRDKIDILRQGPGLLKTARRCRPGIRSHPSISSRRIDLIVDILDYYLRQAMQ